MMNKLLKIGLSALLLFNIVTFGQSRKELEAQRKKLKSEILQVNSLLFKNKQQEKNALDELADLNQKIEVRTAFLNVIFLEAALLAKEIKNTESKIVIFNLQLEALKKDYAAMIFKCFRTASTVPRSLSKAFPQTKLTSCSILSSRVMGFLARSIEKALSR